MVIRVDSTANSSSAVVCFAGPSATVHSHSLTHLLDGALHHQQQQNHFSPIDCWAGGGGSGSSCASMLITL